MARRFLTKKAADYCSARGRPISFKSLQNYRCRGQADPGERGPRFFRDPQSGVCYYHEIDLDAWIAEFEKRLVEGARQPRRPWLDAA